MTKIKDIRTKIDAELATFVVETRAAIAGADRKATTHLCKP